MSHAMTPDRPSRRLPARAWADNAVLAVLAVLGLLGFATAFAEIGYLLAALGGLAVGTAVGILTAAFRVDPLLTGLAAVAAYFLFGSAFAMPEQATFAVLPNLETLAGLAIGAVFGWRDIVTLVTPVAAPDYIAVLPYIAAFVVGIISATIVGRWFARTRRPVWGSLLALLAPLALYIGAVLIGTEEPYLAAVRGIAFAVIALVWMSWRPTADGALGREATSALRRHRIAGIALVSAIAIAGGAVLGGAALPAAESRFVLREVVEPPFDPAEYPSPLSGFREYTKDLDDEVLFEVTGLQPGQRLRIATMDAYDGRLWNVTDPELDAAGSGAFQLVGRTFPQTTLLTTTEDAGIHVEVAAYDDVWLPVAGYPQSISFVPEGAVGSADLRFNDATGIAVVTSGVDDGLVYDVVGAVQTVPEDAALSDTPVAAIALPPVSNVPDIVASKAVEFAGDADSPIEALRRIEQSLRTLGFLSHGSASDAVPSSAGHGADRIKLLLERSQMIGDAEQYAAAFALMARSLNYPARVVMGFAPEVTGDGPVEVTGDDVSAWVEVAFDGVGWIPFYPTPDETDIPQDQTPKPKTEPQPQVRQPPRSDSEQDDLVSAVDIDDSDDEETGPVIPAWVWVVLASVGIPAAIVFLPMLVIAALKRRRRRRRLRSGSPDTRVAGAWDELVDVAGELGFATVRGVTRTRVATQLGERLPGLAPKLALLATTADEAVFSGRRVAADEVRAAWKGAGEAQREAGAAAGRARRLLSRYRLRPRRDVAGALTERLNRAAERAGDRAEARADQATPAAAT